MTCKCVAKRCTWRIHASPNWDKLSFQIKSYNSTHSCKWIFDNCEAISNWVTAQFLHLFKANPNVDIKIIASELKRKFKVACHPIRLYRARNKTLKLLGTDHKAVYAKLRKYLLAIE